MYKPRNLNGWYKLRWQVLERDNFTCRYCGQYAPNVCLEVDHKIALADGGTDDLDNLITSCWACNHGKAGLRQSIALRKLRKEVKIPQTPTRQNQILELIRESTGLTAPQIRNCAGITMSNTYIVLSRLQRKGAIVKSGHKWYVKSVV